MQKGTQQQLNAMDIPIVSEDIIWYLNRSQEQFIDEQYVPLRGRYTDNQNIKVYTTAQQAIENLRTIITTEMIDNIAINVVPQFDNAKSILLDGLQEEFYFYIRSQTRITLEGDWINNDLAEQENIQKFIKTRSNTPMFRNNPVLIEGNMIYVFYDSQENSDIYEVALTYIRSPKELVRDAPGVDETTTCELPPHTHKDIIDLAVVLARKDMKGENARMKREQIEG